MPERPQPRVLSTEQCRAFDRYAINELGIPGIVLMENAGRNAADLIERWALQLRRRAVASGDDDFPRAIGIVCGKGNNGGDGFVIARQLHNRGWPVTVDLAAEAASLSGDAATNHAIAVNMGLAVRELNDPAALNEAQRRWKASAVVVDALLGTGFAGEVREPLAGIIEAINALRADPESRHRELASREPAGQEPLQGEPARPGPAQPDLAPDELIGGEPARSAESPARPLIVAVDVPSGLDADAGTAAGAAIRADRTITFLAAKPGYGKKTARPYVGRLSTVDIGAPFPRPPAAK